MKPSRTRRSTKARPASRPPGAAHGARNRRGAARSAAAKVRSDRKRTASAREESGDRAAPVTEAQSTALHARAVTTQTHGEIERLLRRLREVNARLVVAAVREQNQSDEARATVVRVKAELGALMKRLQVTNRRLATAMTRAHTLAEESERREQEYRQLSSRLLTLQDEERRRLALDLHDSTGQLLAALSMNLDRVERAKEALDAGSRRALAESRSLAEQCSQDVRMYAYLLHPPLLDEAGLPAAVRSFVAGFSKRSGVRVLMNLGKTGRLPGPIETALFRVVQESLTNAHRHALTTTASIRLRTTADEVVLEVQDRGRGLGDQRSGQHDRPDPATLGVGIQGMRERIRQLGGSLDVEFTNRGTTVRVRVPLGGQTS